ncbi:MAG: hypothetical protein HY738_22360 [Bacteroidia bacterium]|nr:hypothetical protein [Bacteroidia bacterium]
MKTKIILLFLNISLLQFYLYSQNNNVTICDSIKFIEFKNEPLLVYNYYLQFQNYYEFEDTSLLISIEYKKIDDSTNLYVITDLFGILELLEKIPSAYTLNDSNIIFFYTGRENPILWNRECIKHLVKVAEKYSTNNVEAISWDEYIFKISKLKLFIYDPFIMHLIIQKGKIISTKVGPTIYKKNMMKPKFINHNY